MMQSASLKQVSRMLQEFNFGGPSKLQLLISISTRHLLMSPSKS